MGRIYTCIHGAYVYILSWGVYILVYMGVCILVYMGRIYTFIDREFIYMYIWGINMHVYMGRIYIYMYTWGVYN